MNAWKSERLRTWIVGTAAMGLLWQSMPAAGYAETPSPANQKKSVAKTVTIQTWAKSKSTIAPASGKSGKSSVKLVSQNVPADGTKSEVQKQLELLYQQDGREMPDMNFNLQPINQGTSPGTDQSQNQQQQPAATYNTPQTQQRPGQASTKAVRPAQGYTQYQPRPQATVYPAQGTSYPSQSGVQQAQSSNTTFDASQGKPRQTVFGFFKKITSNNQTSGLPNQPPVPPDFNTAVPAVTNSAPSYNSTYGVTPQQQSPVRYPEPVQLNNQAARPLISTPQSTPKSVMSLSTPNQTSGVVQSTVGYNSPATQTPALSSQLPALSQQATSPATSGALMPALNDSPTQLNVGTASIRREKTTPGRATVNTDFPNPFPEGAESQADPKAYLPSKLAVQSTPKSNPVQPSRVKTAALPKVEVQEVPKVETIVVGPQESANGLSSGTAKTETSDTTDNPFAVTANNFLEPQNPENDTVPIDPTAPSLEILTTPETDSLEEPRRNEEPAAPAPIQQPEPMIDADEIPATTEEPQSDKMQRIHDRFGMKGLKGFCPVTLRDERELVDAKPEFHITHRRQKFHFASAEARDKFEANPLRYKPAAYGADVVALSRDKDVIEGTLDHAAWYKGRLFLFSSLENYELFLQDPSQYATIEEFE